MENKDENVTGEKGNTQKNIAEQSDGQGEQIASSGISSTHYPFWVAQGYSLAKSGIPPGLSQKSVIPFDLPKKNDCPKGVEDYGDPITLNLANQLVQDFHNCFPSTIYKVLDESSLFSQLSLNSKDRDEALKMLTEDMFAAISRQLIYSISFSKQALLFLLSQPNCAGVKSYFCMGLPNDKLSNDKLPNCNKRKPSLVLVGVDNNNKDLVKDGKNKSIIKFKSATEPIPADTEDAITIMIAKQDTAIVEVGGTDPDNVKTISEFYQEKKRS